MSHVTYGALSYDSTGVSTLHHESRTGLPEDTNPRSPMTFLLVDQNLDAEWMVADRDG